MLPDLWNRLVAWTGAVITPDWGGLVTAIPVLLLLVVLAFVIVTAAKWAGAGPQRTGPGPKALVGPDGLPLRSPTPAPFAVAAGAFVLAFGLVAGSPWLLAGFAVGGVGLAWLVLEVREGSRPTARAGASPRRVTLARIVGIGAVAVVVVVLAATSRVVPEGADAVASAAPPPSGAAPSLAPVPSAAARPTLPPADAYLEADNIAFSQTELAAPAGRPFSVAFDNREKVPHNLEIRDAAGKSMFIGDIVVGPTIVVYEVPALPVGQYPFVCTVHPSMTGTLTVK